MLSSDGLSRFKHAIQSLINDGKLQDWLLDDEIVDPFGQDPENRSLDIDFKRGQSQRQTIRIKPDVIAAGNGWQLTEEVIKTEILRACTKAGMITD